MTYPFYSDVAPVVKIDERGNIFVDFRISGLDSFTTVTVAEGKLTPHTAIAAAKLLMQAAQAALKRETCEVIEFRKREH